MQERDDRPLIYKALKKMNLLGQVDEFYDVGLVGLARGIKGYDESKGYTRSTFYMKCIMNEIKKEIVYQRCKKNEGRFAEISLDTVLKEDAYSRLELTDVIPDEKVDVEHDALTNIHMESVNYYMKKYLSEEQRELINDYYFLGMSATEMAKERGISTQTVYNYINKAIGIIRKHMGDNDCPQREKKGASLEEIFLSFMQS